MNDSTETTTPEETTPEGTVEPEETMAATAVAEPDDAVAAVEPFVQQPETGGATTGAGASGPAAPRPYDFQRPVGMADTTRQLLDLGFAEVAASLGGWIGGQLREQVDASVEFVEEARFGLFRRELARPCVVFLLGVEGSAEPAFLQLETDLAFTLLERVLGSEAEQIHVPERGLTWIERVVLREIVGQCAEIINRAWQEQLAIGLSVTGFESTPEMLPQSNQDATLQSRIRLAGETWVSSLTMVLPASAVAAAITRRREDEPTLNPDLIAQNRRRIEAALQGAGLGLSVRLPTFSVSLRQISDLEVGGFVQSTLGSDAEVEIYVSEELRFMGRVGRQGDHLAVEVIESIPPGAERPDAL